MSGFKPVRGICEDEGERDEASAAREDRRAEEWRTHRESRTTTAATVNPVAHARRLGLESLFASIAQPSTLRLMGQGAG